MFAEINDRLQTYKQIITRKQDLESERKQCSSQLQNAENTLSSVQNSIQEIEDEIEATQYEKSKKKGGQTKKQLHADLYYAQQEMEKWQAKLQELKDGLEKIEESLSTVYQVETNYNQLLAEKRLMILDRQNWTAAQLLILETKYDTIELMLGIMGEFVSSTLHDIAPQKSSMIQTQETQTIPSHSVQKHMFSIHNREVVDQQLDKLKHRHWKLKQLRQEIIQLIENAE